MKWRAFIGILAGEPRLAGDTTLDRDGLDWPTAVAAIRAELTGYVDPGCDACFASQENGLRTLDGPAARFWVEVDGTAFIIAPSGERLLLDDQEPTA